MTLWIDTKYLGIISGRLERFKKLRDGQWLARCPYCGDSKKSKSKARFYIYEKGGKLRTHCFNCEHTGSLQYLLKYIDSSLESEYICEEIKERGGYAPAKQVEPPKMVFRKIVTNLGLKKIMALDSHHSARKYIEARKLPSGWLDRVLYAPRFVEWARGYFPEKFSEDMKEHDRVIISFVKDDKVHALQARALHGEQPKYYTLILDESVPKIFGLEKHDPRKHTYVVEGPFDSMFLPNALAVGSSDLRSALPLVKSHVLVGDNERRNPHIIKLIEKSIAASASVCLWPDGWEYKDINEAVIDGVDPVRIRDTIDANTVSGLGASLRLNMWRRDR